jgi:hypothetical protein
LGIFSQGIEKEDLTNKLDVKGEVNLNDVKNQTESSLFTRHSLDSRESQVMTNPRTKVPASKRLKDKLLEGTI